MAAVIFKKSFSIGELCHQNQYETEILIHEIFYLNTYLSDFLTLSPGAVILDVGANIGIFTLFALKACQGDALIHSFEPIPATFECLANNLAPYRDSTFVYNTGISNVIEDCTRNFTLFGDAIATATYRPQDKLISNYEPLLNYNTLLYLTSFQNKALYYQLKYLPFMRNYLIKKNYKKETAETIIKCKLTSLGHFIENNQLNHIDLLKIDVEGAEVDVLNSIHPHQFSNINQLSIEIHDINNRVEHVARDLKSKGYAVKVSRNPLFKDLGFNHHMIHAKRA